MVLRVGEYMNASYGIPYILYMREFWNASFELASFGILGSFSSSSLLPAMCIRLNSTY